MAPQAREAPAGPSASARMCVRAADAAGTRARCRGVCARRATARTRVTRGVRPGRSA